MEAEAVVTREAQNLKNSLETETNSLRKETNSPMSTMLSMLQDLTKRFDKMEEDLKALKEVQKRPPPLIADPEGDQMMMIDVGEERWVNAPTREKSITIRNATLPWTTTGPRKTRKNNLKKKLNSDVYRVTKAYKAIKRVTKNRTKSRRAHERRRAGMKTIDEIKKKAATDQATAELWMNIDHKKSKLNRAFMTQV